MRCEALRDRTPPLTVVEAQPVAMTSVNKHPPNWPTVFMDFLPEGGIVMGLKIPLLEPVQLFLLHLAHAELR